MNVTLLNPVHRSELAARLAKLSNQDLETKDNGRYVAVKIGIGPNSNVISVFPDHVSFFIRSTDTLKRAGLEGFNPELPKVTSPRNKEKFQFGGLSVSEIDAHEDLFREIVDESVKVVTDRKPKRR